jgi:hypothetical protein
MLWRLGSTAGEASGCGSRTSVTTCTSTVSTYDPKSTRTRTPTSASSWETSPTPCSGSASSPKFPRSTSSSTTGAHGLPADRHIGALLPRLRPGGVYLCEDVIPDSHAFHSYIHGLALNLQAKGRANGTMGRRPTDFQRAIHSVHLYPYIVVIEKRSEAMEEMIDEKHGTEWQPFGHKHLG